MLEALALCLLSVHDGDTFTQCSGVKVRLVAASGPIDAPDFKYSPRCKPGGDGWCDQRLATKARDRLRVILQQPAKLHCTGWDRYHRRLCRVTVGGRDVGDMLVAERLAVVRKDWR